MKVPTIDLSVDVISFQLPMTPDGQSDGKSKLEIGSTLNWKQSANIEDFLLDFNDVISNVPRSTFTIKHDISFVITDPLRAKIYPAPVHLKSCFQDEVSNLQEQNIISPSSSRHCSPIASQRVLTGWP